MDVQEALSDLDGFVCSKAFDDDYDFLLGLVHEDRCDLFILKEDDAELPCSAACVFTNGEQETVFLVGGCDAVANPLSVFRRYEQIRDEYAGVDLFAHCPEESTGQRLLVMLGFEFDTYVQAPNKTVLRYKLEKRE